MRQILSFVILLVLVFDLNNYCGGEKILFFFGGGSYSHKHSVWPWTLELAKRHDVTFISPFEKSPSKHENIRDLASPTLYNLMSKSYDVDRFKQRENGEHHAILTHYSKISIDICDTTLLKSKNDPVLHNLIHNETFDLVVINIIFGECGFALAHHYNAKTIVYDASVTLSWFYDIYGFSAESSWVPDMITKFDNFPLSFIDRMKNTFWPLYWNIERRYTMYPEFDRIIKEAFGRHDFPPFQELEKNASLLLINSHPSFDFALSLPPFAIFVGGINAFLPENEIPEVYQKFMDGAGKEGVVLISFGSTVKLEQVTPYYSRIFFEVIKKHKNVRFLLKWKGPYPKGYETGLDNLLVDDWLPQREILRHPKLKAFVTHGGLNSIQEATFYGVPMVVLPMFADQDYNAYRIEAQQVGFRLEISELNFSLMDNALSKVLGNQRYKHNMEVKSKIFRDRPQTPLESVTFWTEFVLRNDDVTALKPMNSHLTWYSRRLLDVYLVYGVIILIPSFLMGLLLVKLLRKMFSKSKPTTKVNSTKKRS